jgi:GDP-4-dehydro-6-deoxy-D-mannose reductase
LRVLVTGAHGFVGKYLIERLHTRGDSICGIDLLPAVVSENGLLGKWLHGDIRNADFCDGVIDKFKPEIVFHLAGGLNSPILSDLFSTNVQGTLNLLEALRKSEPDAKMIYIGSGAVYGDVSVSRQPITEDEPMNPVTPNGVSKMAADQLCYFYGEAYGLNVVRVRPFNLVGPGQSDNLVCSAFARQLAEVNLGLRDHKMSVGNLSSSRDFLDVRDFVQALILLSENGREGEVYNLCSGQATQIQAVLDTLISLSGLEIEIQYDPARMQQADVPAQVGSNSKIGEDVGWQPEISFEQSLQEMWEDWCQQVENSSK